MINRRRPRTFRMLFLGAVTHKTEGLPNMPIRDGGEPPFQTDFRV